MDKFPEAFERFERDVDTSKIKTFQQLFFNYQMWGKKHAPMTEEQTKALKVESSRLRIHSRETDSRGIEHLRNVKTGRYEKIEKRKQTIL